ncbi:MAG: hypothetical protein DRP32_06045, partial [Thermotogae bacterium]
AGNTENQLMFPMQGDTTRDLFPRDYEESNFSQFQEAFKTGSLERTPPDRPPGVILGLPERADPNEYIVVGQELVDPSNQWSDKKDFLYTKILSRPTREGFDYAEEATVEEPKVLREEVLPPIVQESIVEDEIIAPPAPPVVQRRPPKPEEIWEYVVDDPYQGEDAPPGIYDSDYDSFQDNPVSAETERNKPERYKDPLFGPNLLASIAAGLSDVDLSGASYGVPRYDQDVYASRQLGPSVQNLFRGR